MIDRDGDPYFAFSAVLRIHGANLPLEEITQVLGVTPTLMRRMGDRRRISSPPAKDDAWHFQPDVAEERDLSEHLRVLWSHLKPSAPFIIDLGRTAKVDVFCGYRSNSGVAGFEVAPDALEIFTTLNIPFGVSVIVDEYVADQIGDATTH